MVSRILEITFTILQHMLRKVNEKWDVEYIRWFFSRWIVNYRKKKKVNKTQLFDSDHIWVVNDRIDWLLLLGYFLFGGVRLLATYSNYYYAFNIYFQYFYRQGANDLPFNWQCKQEMIRCNEQWKATDILYSVHTFRGEYFFIKIPSLL